MRDDLRSRNRAGLEARLEIAPAAAPGNEAGGEQVPCTGRVDDLLDRWGRNLGAFAVRDRDCTVGTSRDDQSLNLGCERFETIRQVIASRQVLHFLLVAEQ